MYVCMYIQRRKRGSSIRPCFISTSVKKEGVFYLKEKQVPVSRNQLIPWQYIHLHITINPQFDRLVIEAEFSSCLHCGFYTISVDHMVAYRLPKHVSHRYMLISASSRVTCFVWLSAFSRELSLWWYFGRIYRAR